MGAISSLYGTLYDWGAWGVKNFVPYISGAESTVSADRSLVSREELYQKAHRVFQETSFPEQEIEEYFLAPFKDDTTIRNRVARDIDGRFSLTVKDTKNQSRTFALTKEQLKEVSGDTQQKLELARKVADEFLEYLNEKIPDADLRKFAQSNAQQELFVCILTELNKRLPSIQNQIFSNAVDPYTNPFTPIQNTDQEGLEVVFTLENDREVKISADLPFNLVLASEKGIVGPACQIEIAFSIKLTKEENGKKVKGTLTSMKTNLISCGSVFFELGAKV